MITDIKTFKIRVCKMPEEQVRKIQLDIIQEHEKDGWDFQTFLWTGLYDLDFLFVRRNELSQYKTHLMFLR